MKNIVSKILMMFVVSFMLFTSSYAELNIGDTFVCNQNYNISRFSTVGDYTISQIRTILENYKNYPSTESYQVAFNNLITVFSDLSCNNYFFIGSRSSTSYFFVAYPDNCNLYFNYSDGHQRIYLDSVVDSIFYCIGGNSTQKNTVVSDGIDRIWELSLQSFDCYYSTTKSIKFVEVDNKTIYFNGDYYYQASTTPDTLSGNLIDSEKFKSMISDLTQSDLFYQNVPSSHRKYFFVQYDTEKDRYIFYFYPSNYSIRGLLMNENDYYLISSEDFSWWENVVNFVQGLFKKENEEGFDYKMVYASVLEDGSFDYWFRNKSNEILDKTLFNFANSPLVFSMVDIPFFGKHSGGGIDLDTGDKTLASSPESSLIGQTFEENPLELNPNPTTEVPASEQSFWSKILDRLSDIKSGFLSIPKGIFDILEKKTGSNKLIFFVTPLFETIIELIGLLIACLAFMGRAITFVYTLPTIEASSALFSIDVDTTTKGLAFTGNTWGIHFLSGLDKLKALSWGGASLWSFFEAFVVALVAVIAIKFVRKHYHI